ncbi:ABC transporter substrate-binding protein [Xinfangfangia sp. D13-10-4-6]|uniref:ABC transporter substrate-binding protein n=1 Tax=Pseudogemmobacter hezensis TaxID=2737662 RepID=UPI0015553BE5|nr:ABC transporter substrate-binding protein [Pseudogemmobacter hezensis]NPD13921.1 ABC transporter substrate-binding protein [Pseudogemmobacter hezensis]
MSLLTRRVFGAAMVPLLAGLIGFAAPARAFDGQTVQDATGRQVLVPADPARVFAAGPPASVLLYALKPEAMVGWVMAPKAGDLPYLLPQTRDLPALGRLTGKGDTLNLEVLLTTDAQLIVDFGTVNDTYRDLATRIEDQAGLPYLLIDGSFAATPQAIRQLAAVLQVPDRGEALAAYAEATYAEADALLAQIPQADRPRVYLARGPEGLESPARGSINAEIIERMGGTNVVEAETRGLVTVSPEQIQAWAPDIILTVEPGFPERVAQMPEWQGIPAVDQGRVYLVPAQPFGFIDAPPSVNRLIGLKYLAHLFYPDQASGDLREEIRDFYTLFYQVTPDEAGLDALLGQ